MALDHEHRSRRSVVATEKMFHVSRNAAPSAAFQDFEKRNPGFLLATTRPEATPNGSGENELPKTSRGIFAGRRNWPGDFWPGDFQSTRGHEAAYAGAGRERRPLFRSHLLVLCDMRQLWSPVVVTTQSVGLSERLYSRQACTYP